MNECFQKIFLLDGRPCPCQDFDHGLVYDRMAIYEVIRVIKGLPLFMEDHFERLYETARIKDLKIRFKPDLLAREIKKLITLNGVDTGNLKVVLSFNNGSGAHRRLMYFIEHHYPTEDQYQKGVSTILYQAERLRPAAKVINHRLRSSIFRKLIETGAYEALLVNRSGCITEGSRSNVFFVSQNELFTAPDGEVLSGIVRKYVLEYCRLHKIPVHFQNVKIADLGRFQSCFLTGTSPAVLPVSSIGHYTMQPGHALVRFIMEGYREIIRDHIDHHK
jgi:branched-chain amino acid aminotransferase